MWEEDRAGGTGRTDHLGIGSKEGWVCFPRHRSQACSEPEGERGGGKQPHGCARGAVTASETVWAVNQGEGKGGGRGRRGGASVYMFGSCAVVWSMRSVSHPP